MAFMGMPFAHQGFAVPRVGKLDGASGPSLPPVATPLGLGGGSMVQEELLADTQLPVFMEKNGDWRGAATAWQTVAHDSIGQARTRALLRAGNALATAGEPVVAATLYLTALPEAGALSGETVYAFSRALDGAVPVQERRRLVALLSQRVAIGSHNDASVADDAALAWRQAGLYRLGWQEARTGLPEAALRVPEAPLPQLNELRRRVTALDATLAWRVGMAGVVGGAMPGLGHAWLGEERTAAGILPLWALAVWLTLWHMRRRQWPYAALWATVTLAIWLGSALTAMALAREQNARLRGETLDGWADLRPRDPVDGKAPVLPQLGVAMPVAEDGGARMKDEERTAVVSATVAVTPTVRPTVEVKAGDVFVMKAAQAPVSGSVAR